MNLNRYLDIAPEVKKALDEGRPVVALESTIISHGMPYPQNVETALNVEKIIRDHGAVPATIAIIKGRLKAGLSAEEKKDCTRQMTANLEDLNAENEIETLVKAKGFADCLCFLQSGRADLTVMTSGDALTAAQVAQIRDIVLSKSEVTAQNITVVEVK